MGVPPMVFESQPDKEAFDKAYPDGVDTRFYLHSSFDKTDSDAVVVGPSASDSTYSQLIFGFVIGLVTALIASCLYQHWCSKSRGYDRISDGPGL